MDLLERLRLMPPGTLVLASWVLDQLQGDDTAPSPATTPPTDLTVREVAER